MGGAPSRTSDETRAAEVRRLGEKYAAKFPDVPDVEASEVLRATATSRVEATTTASAPEAVADAAPRPWIIVDNRKEAERAVSFIPHSLAPAAFDALRASSPAVVREARVACYCTAGYRSALATRALREEGVDAVNLRGGILGWIHAGGVLVNAANETTKDVHVFGREWALAPEGYREVTFWWI